MHWPIDDLDGVKMGRLKGDARGWVYVRCVTDLNGVVFVLNLCIFDARPEKAQQVVSTENGITLYLLLICMELGVEGLQNTKNEEKKK